MLHHLQSPSSVAVIKIPICEGTFIKIGLMCTVKEYDFTLRYSTFWPASVRLENNPNNKKAPDA